MPENILDNVVHCMTKEELKEKLHKKNLRIKYGADPTSPDLHLGHTVVLRKLRQFQELGHTVVFIVGDFTATIGDPSEQNRTRPMLSKKQVKKNAQTYLDQVFQILDPKQTEVRCNSEWLCRLRAEDIVRLASHLTVARLLERNDFEKRMKEEKPIACHELFYPLFQAYDSVCVKADVEVGGTDQLYNLLLGRDLQQAHDMPPQVVLTLPLLTGLDGERKMSKTYGNAIALRESASEMFGKLMSIPDQLMKPYALLLTDCDNAAWAEREQAMQQGENPMRIKEEMAKTITANYQGKEKAEEAAAQFHQVFSERKLPEEMPLLSAPPQPVILALYLKEIGFAPSRSAAQRLIAQKAVKINGKVIQDPTFTLSLHPGDIVQVGRRKFGKVR